MGRDNARRNEFDRAVEGSLLASLPPEVRAQLLADAVTLDVPAGGVIYRDEDQPRIGLVIAGLTRVFLTSVEGRQVTVRYARAGAVLGAPTAVGGPVSVSVQAVTDSSVLMFSAARLAEAARADAAVAWPLAQEITRLLYGVLDAFSARAFGSVRQRLARHLLDLAAAEQRDARLVAAVSQQDLADAVGTAREVVARTLAEFRRDGLIDGGRRGVTLLDPLALDSIANEGS